MNEKNFRFNMKLVLVSHFLILGGAGHGIGCIGLFQIAAFPYVDQEGFSISWNAGYDASIPFVALLSTIADILIILPLYLKIRSRVYILSTGLLFQAAAFLYLTHEFRCNSAAKLSLMSGIPWLIFTVLLCLQLYVRSGNKKRSLIH